MRRTTFLFSNALVHQWWDVHCEQGFVSTNIRNKLIILYPKHLGVPLSQRARQAIPLGKNNLSTKHQTTSYNSIQHSLGFYNKSSHVCCEWCKVSQSMNLMLKVILSFITLITADLCQSIHRIVTLAACHVSGVQITLC